MTPIKFILVGIALVLVAQLVSRWRRREIGILQLAVWGPLFGCGAILALFPDFSTRIANALGVGRGADLVLYLSVVILFYAQFRLVLRTERLNRALTELVRTDAIERRLLDDRRTSNHAGTL